MLEHRAREDLLSLAESFHDATKTTHSTIGKRALNDNTFFGRIKSGDSFRVDTFDKVVRWFSENWPEGVKWPADVERPVRRAAA